VIVFGNGLLPSPPAEIMGRLHFGTAMNALIGKAFDHAYKAWFSKLIEECRAVFLMICRLGKQPIVSYGSIFSDRHAWTQ